MKVLVVLVLVVFTGCNAIRVNSDRQKPKLEVLEDFLWSHAITNLQAASDIHLNFRRTEFGNAIEKSLEKVGHASGMFLTTLMQSLPPTTYAIMQTSIGASFKLASHVKAVIKNELEPMAEKAAPVMEEALGQLIEGSQLVQDTVSPYITELMERVDPIFQNIQARLHALKKSFDKTA